MAMPWLTTATVCPSCRAARSWIARVMRFCTSRIGSPPGTDHFSGSVLKQRICSGNSCSTSPQARPSHTPMQISARRGVATAGTS